MSGLPRRGLSVVLGGLVVLAAVGLVAIVVAPIPLAPPSTELYVLNETGTAAGYPNDLAVGEAGTVRVGVANHEHDRVAYTLVVRTNASTLETREVALADGAVWEEPVSFAFDSPGRRVVRFELYRGDGGGAPYRLADVRVRVR